MPKRKRILVLPPVHSLWAAFHTALGQNLQAEERSGAGLVCHHDKRMPACRKALEAVGLAQRNVITTLQFFRERGLPCDCAVWAYPENLVGEVRPV